MERMRLKLISLIFQLQSNYLDVMTKEEFKELEDIKRELKSSKIKV